MALQNLVGSGLWLPSMQYGFGTPNTIPSAADIAVDTDEKEFQIIGRVHIDGGGSKTFGTSGSKVGWYVGASNVFNATSTLRVGLKTVDAANGPVARATIGQAAFSVYDDLLAGTDTITSTTWRDDAMSAGTPFTVTHGDLIAICFHLDKPSGTSNVKIRMAFSAGSGDATSNLPVLTLVTSGPTYTAQAAQSNVILTFDDGSLGWILPTIPFVLIDTASGTIGNTNIFGNLFRVPYSCKVDAICAVVAPGAGNADFALQLYSTPLGTPVLVESVDCDANITAASASGKTTFAPLVTARTLTIDTDYVIGIKQTTANAVTARYRDVSTAAYWKAWGMGAECYAAHSTAGATFAQQNSGLRRYLIWVRVSALEDGVQVGGGRPEFRGSNL